MKFFIFSLALTIFSPPAFSQSESKVKVDKASEIILPGFQKNALGKDGPIQDFVFLKDRLAMIGSHNLWVWDLIENTLKKIPLQKRARGVFKLRHISSDGIHIFAASSNTLFQITIADGRILKFASPFNKKGLSLGFAGSKDNIWWLHTAAIMRIDRYGRTLVPTFKPEPITRKDKFYFDTSKKVLWLARNNQLISYDLAQSPVTKKLAMKAKHSFQGLQGTQNGLALHTGRSLLRLDQNAQLIQAIPVEGHRKLIDMELAQNFDTFLFSDALLERYNLTDKTVSYHKLQLIDPNSVRKLATHNQSVALLSLGEVRVFNLISRK